MYKNAYLSVLLAILLLTSCSSVSRNPSSVYVTTGADQNYAVPLNTVRAAFKDGTIDVLSINMNSMNLNHFLYRIEVKEWAGDKVYIDFKATAESQRCV